MVLMADIFTEHSLGPSRQCTLDICERVLFVQLKLCQLQFLNTSSLQVDILINYNNLDLILQRLNVDLIQKMTNLIPEVEFGFCVSC